jgi:hypothetical protein
MSFVSIATDFLRLVAADLNEYTTEKSTVKTKNFKEVTLFTPAHIQFAKYGRGPGKKPPLDSILEWVSSKGIIFEGTSERGTAFAIQTSIGKNGTKNWVPNAPNAIDEAVLDHLVRYQKDVAKFVYTQAGKEIDQYYDKAIPKKTVMHL